MKVPGHQQFSFSQGKDGSRISHGFQPDSDFSMASAYSACSADSERSLHSTNSFRSAAQKIASPFITCFSPNFGRTSKETHLEGGTIQTSDFSISSTATSKYSSSYSTETQQETTKFSIADIYKATANFSVENRIGVGGFGAVYKGKLKDGSQIAVKRATKNMYDKHLTAEFESEIQTLSNVEHLNLVKFLGYLEHADERLIVVEYVSNGNLREHLDGSRGDALGLSQRLNIAIDVAHALTYLHAYTDRPIIHRDIKASNILLTEKLRAKVSDFGFARFADDPEVTHISTQIKGTAGYLDPEYLKTYQLTNKSDVYSFGVLLVELVTGRHPIERNRDQRERITTRWAIHKFKEGDAVLAMDPRLRRSPAAIAAVERVMELADRCLAPSRLFRPTMRKCAETLWPIRKEYREAEMLAAAPRRPPAMETVEEEKGEGERSSSKSWEKSWGRREESWQRPEGAEKTIKGKEVVDPRR